MNSVEEILAFLTPGSRYKTLNKLGEGAMGTVSAVYDTMLQRVVAQKLMNRAHMTNADLVQTFVNEIKLMGRLTHPGVLSIYNAMPGENGSPAYTMKLAEGESLTAALQMKKGRAESVPLPLEQAVRILVKLCETLTFAHDRGILHLDLKPENIMLGHYGEVFIMDWGAARVYDTNRFNADLKQQTGGIAQEEKLEEHSDLLIGTPGYMSPEQLRERRDKLGPQSDIFSVGVMFYQMLTGIHPFLGGTLEQMKDKVFNHEVPAAHELNLDVPHSLSRICDRMLKKPLQERFQTCREVLNSLDEYQRSGFGFPVRTYGKGEVIFSEGDPSDYVCIVETGRVEISVMADGERKVIASLGAGEPFGELAALTGNPRTATATAVEKSGIRMVSRDDIGAEIDKLSSWVGAMVEALSNRFVEMNERVLELEKNADR